ncbi:MAG: trigger factor [Chloroflexota bacterium]|nr:trigger factor [Chloroflexota bacterium]MDE2941014.1 trigger factor [Chloroflexota bacterium]MDE3268218.1 trigger factor [Chloroflexota bacterium]
MKVSQLEESQSQVVLSIEVEPPELEEHLDRVYRRAVQRVNIPGFRRGKAPRSVVERELGRDAMVEDALDTLLPQITSRAIQEQELDIISLPQVRVTEYDPLTIQATVPVRPTIDLGDYYSHRVEQESVEVSPEAVDELLNSMLEDAGTWEPVERPVALDDLVTIEVRGQVDEEVVIEEDRVDYRVTADSTVPMPGFAEQLVGLNRDEEQHFSLTFADDHAQESWAGKECAFTLTVHEVKERKLPELDDEFVKSLNNEDVESVAALREKLEEDLLRRSRLIADQTYQEKAIQTLVDGSTIEVPPLLIDHEIEHIISEQQEALQRQQVRMEDYLSTIGKSVEQIQEELRPSATDRITRTLILGALREKEGIEVTDEEVNEEIESMLGESDTATDAMRQMLEGSRNSISTMLLNRKTLERLTAITKGEATEPAPTAVSASDETSEEETSEAQEGA